MTESRGNKKHKDMRPAEVRNSEKIVNRAICAVKNFLNPFDVPDKQRLYCLSSGASVDSNVEHCVLTAETLGKEAKEKFVKDRLEKKDHFFEPVKRMNLKTMSSAHKTGRVKSTKNKIIEFKQQSTVMINLLVRSQEGSAVDIEDLMTYPLTPVPFSIGTADGFMTKNDKSKGFDYLTKDIDSVQLPPFDTTLTIEDGNALFYYMHDLPGNFKEIVRKIFDLMGKNCNVVFSTDTYLPNSIKAMERRRRGCGEKLIVQGELTKRPADWKAFLTNDQNKKQLIQLILDIWSSADFARNLATRNIIVIAEGHAYQLQSLDGQTTDRMEIMSLHSTQEETDTRIILYCKYAQDNGYEYVRVRSPDSDVFFVLLLYVHEMTITVFFDTGTGNRRRLINISELAEDFTTEYATALAALHVFTHCDTTSAFKGIGKVKPIKLLQTNPKYQPILAQLGACWDPSPSLVCGLEEFTCVLYGRKKFTSVDKLRYALIKEKCGSEDGFVKLRKNVDLSTLPPCSRALLQHIRRANYQMCINRNAHVPVLDVPSPTEGHGWQMVDGNLEPLWFDGDLVPPVVVDNADDNQGNSDSEEDTADEDLSRYDVEDSDSADEF